MRWHGLRQQAQPDLPEHPNITPSIRRFAAEQIKHATAFLAWLGERDTALAACGQADIDAWWAENGEHNRNCLRAFLNWAIQSRHCQRPLSIPAMRITRRAALGEDERLDVLGRLRHHRARGVLPDPHAALPCQGSASPTTRAPTP
ncbi:hypothetical protein CRV15_29685 (plasmid) [Streptomyces clavuligerus]|uniref:Uncharacterized protein n=1 Tax=Streptomyces clavuligerus TaxID=1901 RepID=B5GS16_STRCL|nr:hypothetical protein [Streptomyces clavuligerus]EDY49112.1 hypothetical protein SSCG_02140 [Streptomyces clavuligerus]EFG03810.1 Hypothetical protein SCLAV_p0319 [Streptomyces clavuligerus]QCS10895.1 hypothetical protein CRV15_29685 [Streptomyces clavuligerus]QPJ98171.1 hypothetical protein GE265_34725 [Streptomyces clavuligerus]